MRSKSAFLAVCLATTFGQAASAETLKFLTNRQYQEFPFERDAILNETTNATLVKFKVEKRKLVVVTFSASCYINGSAVSGMHVTIHVKFQGKNNFVALPPTDAQSRFCSPAGNTAVSQVGTAIGGLEMPGGEHAIRVSVHPFNGASQTNLQGQTLHIQD